MEAPPHAVLRHLRHVRQPHARARRPSAAAAAATGLLLLLLLLLLLAGEGGGQQGTGLAGERCQGTGLGGKEAEGFEVEDKPRSRGLRPPALPRGGVPRSCYPRILGMVAGTRVGRGGAGMAGGTEPCQTAAHRPPAELAAAAPSICTRSRWRCRACCARPPARPPGCDQRPRDRVAGGVDLHAAKVLGVVAQLGLWVPGGGGVEPAAAHQAGVGPAGGWGRGGRRGTWAGGEEG